MKESLFPKLLKPLDAFLPAHLDASVEASVFYRARIVIATNIISFFIITLLWGAVYFLNISHFIHIGILFSGLILIVHMYYLKSQTDFKFFEKKLFISAVLQVLMLDIVVYLTSYSSGLGIFGAIWLLPIFLMIAFYFRTYFSFYFAVVNFLIFIGISLFKLDSLNDPVKRYLNFSIVFFVFFCLILAFCFIMTFIFVALNEHLQREVLKQKDLLLESAKFQSLGKMASNLAHDINNPLFTIQGKLHQIRNLLSRDQLDLEKCDNIVENIETTILKLSQIVKGISTFAREGRGDQMISIKVSELIENNLALAIDRIKNSGIELEIIDHPTAQIICYPSFISQVVLNLLNNAIDALEFASTKEIKVKIYSDQSWIFIEVWDSGIGVASELEEKIFEPFFTTKTFGNGTGLGLSISKGLVEVHEGKLSYERSELYTKFIVQLPTYE